MGGRGSSSGGRSGRAPRGYRTVARFHGISVIKSSDPQNNILPRHARPNSQFLGMSKKGDVKQLRIYDENGNAKKDIDWQHSFDGHSEGSVHCHEWNGPKRSLEHSPLTKSEVSKYKKAIEKASGRKDLIWEW